MSKNARPLDFSGMEFEELVLRPASGVVDVVAVTAWLNALPHAFHDPVAGDSWHVSATTRTAASNRRARLADLPEGDPQGAIRLEIEDLEGIEDVHVDPRSPPGSCKPVVALEAGWIAALDTWQPGDAIDGFASVRAAT